MNVLQPTHIIFLGLLALIIFGPQRLPEIGRSLGKGMREFKESVSGATDMKDALASVNEVRTSLTPANVVGAAVPGVREMQQTATELKTLGSPLADVTAPDAAAATPPQQP